MGIPATFGESGPMNIPTIVVGVDDGPASHSALRLAIDEATLRGCRVVIVTCWSSPAHQQATAQSVAAHAIASAAATDHERTFIVTTTSEGAPGPELVHASLGAELLVIGSTTRSALARHRGKPVVDHCLRHCDVPVLVVPYQPAVLDDSDIGIDDELLGAPTDGGADIPVRYDPFASQAS